MVGHCEIWFVVLSAISLTLHVLADATNCEDFKVNWCRQRKWRLDWEKMLKPCETLDSGSNTGGQYERFKTSADQSEIFDLQLRPAGEYSRFFVQSRTQDGQRKTTGGDSWRVYLEGSSYLAGTVFDHNNGVYEVLFLIMEPGIYKINMILDYTLCKGLIDPPINWFKTAHCQGKVENIPLSNKLFPGNINKPLLSAQNERLNIPPARLTEIEIQKNMREADSECDTGCNLMWDGYGRWVQLPASRERTWKPYMNSSGEDFMYLKTQHKHHNHTPGQGVFWVYGDSLSFLFYKSITQPARLLCKEIFKECNNTHNWLYPLNLYKNEMIETCSKIDLDVPEIVNFLREVISRKDMDQDSALLLNAGAHYVKTTSFQSYQSVIRAFISKIKRLYRGKAIWKSTTAIHEQTAEIMGPFRRFTTSHRTELFNAYANSAMCKNNITVLDVYPISSSYPKGTKDGIHYEDCVFEPVIQLLEKYFSR